MDLDERLRLLANAPTPPGLAALTEGVFDRIAADAQARKASGAGIVTAATLALAIGAGSTLLPAARAVAQPASPLLPMTLAPSTLLTGE